jgi:hypothetical protein
MNNEQHVSHGGLTVFEPLETLSEHGFLHARVNNKMYPPFINRDILKELQLRWNTDENDIFISTHQKVGTHLTKKFVSEILRKGVDYPEEHPMKTGDIGHHTIPWPEVMASQYGLEKFFEFIDRTKGFPRVWYIHCFIEDLPVADIHPETKFINVFRDPKGAALSQYFFYKSHPLLGVNPELTMDQFIDYFVHGDLYFGDYHKHTLNWTEALDSTFNSDRLLTLRYEDLVERKMDSAKLLTQFLLGDERMINEVGLNEIIEKTDFSKMKKSITENPGSFHFNPNTFFRSGTTYDWQEKLSSDQINKIDIKSRLLWGHESYPDLSGTHTLDAC